MAKRAAVIFTPEHVHVSPHDHQPKSTLTTALFESPGNIASLKTNSLKFLVLIQPLSSCTDLPSYPPTLVTTCHLYPLVETCQVQLLGQLVGAQPGCTVTTAHAHRGASTNLQRNTWTKQTYLFPCSTSLSITTRFTFHTDIINQNPSISIRGEAAETNAKG